MVLNIVFVDSRLTGLSLWMKSEKFFVKKDRFQIPASDETN